MSYIYLASPYTTTDKFARAARYRLVCRATAALMERGELVFAPVAYGHSLEERLSKNFPYEYWIRWSKVMLSGASRLYVLTVSGWQDSKGIGVEVKLAHELNIPVQGYAFGPDSEDVSGLDILGHFGLALVQSRPVFVRVLDQQVD